MYFKSVFIKPIFIVTNLTLPKERKEVQGARPLPGVQERSPFRGGFAARHGAIKCNFTAAPQAEKERFLYLFQIKHFILFTALGNEPLQDYYRI